MGFYNVIDYAGAASYYGESPRLKYSSYPFSTLALSYSQVFLDWVAAEGDYTEVRILRSYDGFPETAQDGVLIWNWFRKDNTPQVTEFIDGNGSVPLISGRFVYYRIWLRTNANNWVVAADSYVLLPLQHSSLAPDGTELVTSQNKLLDVLPRVFTTAGQSPLEEVDEESDLSRFLSAFALEIDTILTYTELMMPLEAGRLASPALLLLQSIQLGLPIEPFLATKQQRHLAREALYIYQNKGTESAIGRFVESLTGFAPDVTLSPNLVLTTQDGSFTGGLGFWRPVGAGIELTTETTVPGVTPDIEPYVNDYRYVGKIVNTVPGSRIINGTDDPINKGTPVEAGQAYTFSGYGKAASGSMNVYAYATWYDYKGEVIRVDPPRDYVPAPQAITTNWTKFQFTGRSPGVVRDVLGYSVSAGVMTLYLTAFNVMVRGESVRLANMGTLINGIHLVYGGGFTQQTITHLYVETNLADTAYVATPGATFTEVLPELGQDYYYPVSGSVTNGIATVNFSGPTSLVAGDYLLLLAFDADFSFGVQTILSSTNGGATVTFPLLATNGLPASDRSYPLGSGPINGAYGYGREQVKGAGTTIKSAVYVGFEFVILSAGTIYVDLLQMAKYEVAKYHEPRGVEIFLNSINANYLKNPGFNPSNSSAWTVAGSSVAIVDRVADLGLSGAGYAAEVSISDMVQISSVSITNNVATFSTPLNNTISTGQQFYIVGSGDNPLLNQLYTAVQANSTSISVALPYPVDVPTTPLPSVAVLPAGIGAVSEVVTSGKFITASIYSKVNSSYPVALQLIVRAIDGITQQTVATVTKTVMVTSTMTRFSATIYVPKVSPESVVVSMQLGGPIVGASKIWFDHAQVETSFKPTDYFDGDLPPSHGAIWSGTPYNSVTHSYPNLPIKVTRLQQELKKYIPVNASFLVRWQGNGIALPLI